MYAISLRILQPFDIDKLPYSYDSVKLLSDEKAAARCQIMIAYVIRNVRVTLVRVWIQYTARGPVKCASGYLGHWGTSDDDLKSSSDQKKTDSESEDIQSPAFAIKPNRVNQYYDAVMLLISASLGLF